MTLDAAIDISPLFPLAINQHASSQIRGKTAPADREAHRDQPLAAEPGAHLRQEGRTAIATGDRDAAQSAFRVAQPELHRATTKGVLHKNTVARKLSRLAARINAL